MDTLTHTHKKQKTESISSEFEDIDIILSGFNNNHTNRCSTQFETVHCSATLETVGGNCLKKPVTVLLSNSSGSERLDFEGFTKTLPDSHAFKTVLQFTKETGCDDVKVSTVYSVGYDVGVPLERYIKDQWNLVHWEYDRNNRYLRCGAGLRKLGRLIASAVFYLHDQLSKCIGGDLLNNLFVKGRGTPDFPFVVTVMRHRADLDLHIGGYMDLVGIRDFVQLVQNTYRIRSNSPARYDLDAFYALVSSIPPHSTPQMFQAYSYFVCHSPIFWDYDQRFSFICSFYQRRIQYNNRHGRGTFDSLMRLDRDPDMDNRWSNVVSNTNSDLHSIYNGSNYGGASTILPFHRNAVLHHASDQRVRKRGSTLTSVQVDFRLVELFPYAIPVAYKAVVEKLFPVDNDVIAFLRGGPHGLDYSKLVPR